MEIKTKYEIYVQFTLLKKECLSAVFDNEGNWKWQRQTLGHASK